jgi:hypothetical protein
MEEQPRDDRTGEMDQAAASVVAELALTVDGSCPYCARELLMKLADRFPEHAAVFSDAIPDAGLDDL